jgi:NADPH:quinone reductase-like Zn-dependent oxidoreductase
MSSQQKALWLKEAKAEFAVGPKPIDKPGPGELLVKIEATALNPVSTVVRACVRTSRQQSYRSSGRCRSTRLRSR